MIENILLLFILLLISWILLECSSKFFSKNHYKNEKLKHTFFIGISLVFLNALGIFFFFSVDIVLFSLIFDYFGVCFVFEEVTDIMVNMSDIQNFVLFSVFFKKFRKFKNIEEFFFNNFRKKIALWFETSPFLLNFKSRWYWMQQLYLVEHGLAARSYLFWLNDDVPYTRSLGWNMFFYFNLIEISRFLRVLMNPLYLCWYVLFAEALQFRTNMLIEYKRNFGKNNVKFWFLDHFFFSTLGLCLFVFKSLVFDFLVYIYHQYMYSNSSSVLKKYGNMKFSFILDFRNVLPFFNILTLVLMTYKLTSFFTKKLRFYINNRVYEYVHLKIWLNEKLFYFIDDIAYWDLLIAALERYYAVLKLKRKIYFFKRAKKYIWTIKFYESFHTRFDNDLENFRFYFEESLDFELKYYLSFFGESKDKITDKVIFKSCLNYMLSKPYEPPLKPYLKNPIIYNLLLDALRRVLPERRYFLLDIKDIYQKTKINVFDFNFMKTIRNDIERKKKVLYFSRMDYVYKKISIKSIYKNIFIDAFYRYFLYFFVSSNLVFDIKLNIFSFINGTIYKRKNTLYVCEYNFNFIYLFIKYWLNFVVNKPKLILIIIWMFPLAVGCFFLFGGHMLFFRYGVRRVFWRVVMSFLTVCNYLSKNFIFILILVLFYAKYFYFNVVGLDVVFVFFFIYVFFFLLKMVFDAHLNRDISMSLTRYAGHWVGFFFFFLFCYLKYNYYYIFFLFFFFVTIVLIFFFFLSILIMYVLDILIKLNLYVEKLYYNYQFNYNKAFSKAYNFFIFITYFGNFSYFYIFFFYIVFLLKNVYFIYLFRIIVKEFNLYVFVKQNLLYSFLLKEYLRQFIFNINVLVMYMINGKIVKSFLQAYNTNYFNLIGFYFNKAFLLILLKYIVDCILWFVLLVSVLARLSIIYLVYYGYMITLSIFRKKFIVYGHTWFRV